MAGRFDNYETGKFEVTQNVSGWLFPNGYFDDCLYGEHTTMAFMYLDDYGWKEEWRKARHEYHGESVRDWLVRVKHMILLDSPCCRDTAQYITFNPLVKYTKAQKDKLTELFEKEQEVLRYIVENIR